jgi:uncharacterized protein (DUF58 family)
VPSEASRQRILEICKNRKKNLLEVKSKVKTMLQGEHPSHFVGLGIEYERAREYAFGDDYRRIEWSLTARTPPKPDGETTLFVKQYREEKNLNVLLIMDQSGSMEYRDKIPTAVRLALVVADLAQRRGDYVGLTSFREKLEFFLPPARSVEQAYRILSTLCRSYRAGGTSNLRTMAVEVARVLRSRSIVNLITDINHEASDFTFFAHLMWAAGHMANVMLIADESETNLPDVGWLTLTENEELQKTTIDTSELKSEYDNGIRLLLKNINAGCEYFGGKVLLFSSPREVDSRIPKIASLYRQAREGVYR